MTETIYEKEGKIPVVGRTYRITDEYIEYNTASKDFTIQYDEIEDYSANRLGDELELAIEVTGGGGVFNMKINKTAFKKFKEQLAQHQE